MNVIFLSTLSIDSGGAERLLIEEAKYFSQKEDVELLVTDTNEEILEEHGLDQLEITEFNAEGILPTSRFLRNYFKENNPDLVISHYADIIGYLSTVGLDIDLSCHINGSPFWFQGNWSLIPHKRKSDYKDIIKEFRGHREFRTNPEVSWRTRMKLEVRQKIRKRAINSSIITTTISNQVAKELQILYGREIPVINPGIDNRFFDDEISEIELSESDYNILNISRLDSRKRNRLLIKSFASLCDERDDIKLIIGGKGPEREGLESLAEKLGVSESVKFEGYIDEEKLPSYYKSSDLFVHPAWVAYGLSPLEAYATGTNIVISTDTMAKEVVNGAPGVHITEPEEKKVAEKINKGLKQEQETDRTIIPTWEEYCEKKYEAVKSSLND